MSNPSVVYRLLLFFLLGAVLVSACSNAGGVAPSPIPGSTPESTRFVSHTPFQPSPTLTPTPSPTPVALAARVNQEGITLAEYEAELKRLQNALKSQGKELSAAEQRKRVLDDLIWQTLMAQAAFQAGYQLDDAALEARIQKLAQEAGGEAALKEWLSRNAYTDASFRVALRRAAAAAWQRDQIAAAVPETADQVRARQILVSDNATAESILSQLRAGVNFGTLASRYDPLTGGEMGWFPRGYLPHPEIEAAAFALKPGEYSPIIPLKIGYLIIQVTERNPQQRLSADARRTLQGIAVQNWLKDRLQQSKIEIFVP